jgi:hypothetical protein
VSLNCSTVLEINEGGSSQISHFSTHIDLLHVAEYETISKERNEIRSVSRTSLFAP